MSNTKRIVIFLLSFFVLLSIIYSIWHNNRQSQKPSVPQTLQEKCGTGATFQSLNCIITDSEENVYNLYVKYDEAKKQAIWYREQYQIAEKNRQSLYSQKGLMFSWMDKVFWVDRNQSQN